VTQPQYGYGPPQGYPPPDPYAQQGPYQPAPQYGPPPGYQAPPPAYGQPGQYGPPPGAPNPGYGVPQQPPAPQGAKGTLDDFYGQPSGTSGKGISWKNKPNGYRYVGVVRRTPQDSDVFQDSDPQTKTLKTWRDGAPKMVLPVPLDLVWLDAWQQQEYADREAAVFLRGGMRDEVTRAMQEAGVSGVPQQGALMDVTLTHRKPGNNIATNMYAVVYRPAGTWENDPAYAWVAQQLNTTAPNQQVAPAEQYPQQQPPAYGAPYGGAPQGPYQQQAPAQYAAPAQAAPAPNTQQYAQPQMATQQYGGQAYDPNNPMNQPYGIGAKGYDPVGDAVQGNGPLATPQQRAAVQQPQPQNQQYNDPSQVNGQQQLPYGNQPPQGPQAQAGVTQSQLAPAQQQLLGRLTGGQAGPAGPVPAGGPQGQQG
jgi:hypothetical protein